MTEPLSVPLDAQRQVNTSAVPGVAEFVGRHRRGAERGRRLGIEESESDRDLAAGVGAQAHVVDEHEQPHVGERVLGAHPHRHVVDHHAELALEIDALVEVVPGDGIGRPAKVVGCSLVDERELARLVRFVGVQCLGHQVEMRLEDRTVEPLRCPGERRQRGGALERRHEVADPGVARLQQLDTVRRAPAPT